MTFRYVASVSQPAVSESLVHSNLSQRALSAQIQAQLLLQVRLEQDRLRQIADMERQVLFTQQDQQVRVVHNAIQMEYQRNQQIDRLLHGIEIMEQTNRHHQPLLLPSVQPWFNIGATSTLSLNTVDASLHLNQSSHTSIYPGIPVGVNPNLLHDALAATSILRPPPQPPYDLPAVIASTFGRPPTQATTQVPNIPSHLSSSLSINVSNDQISNSASHAAAVQRHQLLYPSSVPESLPVLLGHLDVHYSDLSEHQRFARQQIELFEASADDAATHRRGRNKPIELGQVGIRCKHCTRVPTVDRQKGSLYFPSTISGVYQAAQNMSALHIANGSCHSMPASVKNQFATLKEQKQNSPRYTKNGGRREYWVKSVSELGLIDIPEHGIRFIRSWESGVDDDFNNHGTAVDGGIQR